LQLCVTHEYGLYHCTGEGIMEYTCTRCGATRLEGDAAAGHIPGDAATCTTPQLCTKCGAVIENALGHDYQEDVTAPTCTAMGFTTFTCSRCGDTYDGAYTDPTGHTPSEWIVDKEPDQDSAGSRHKECTEHRRCSLPSCRNSIDAEDYTFPAD
jgi:DNA-directed RNA polymerase subunit RPC12/RpoP